MRNVAQVEAVVRDNAKPPLDDEPIIRSVELVHLRPDGAGWDELYSSFALGVLVFNAPWNRCLSLLNGLGAKTCVIEQNYVCLDYKSEMLSFYSQLDATREVSTTRLHFFSSELTEEEVFDLGAKSETYLGYIVCRHGNLPLVGRCNIAAPTYIEVVASVSETVHFFGQQVRVIGVPFMQQDSQFAVCSQVAVWAAHYAAFRRGLVQRRLVAEIVAMSGVLEPMKPHVSEGLNNAKVAELFHAAGLNTNTYNTPRSGPVEYPPIDIESIDSAGQIVDRIRKLIDEEAKEASNDERATDPAATDAPVVDFDTFRDPVVDLAEFASDIAAYVELRHANNPLRREATALQDLVLAYLFRPYLRSRLPVYCGVKDHAVLLCGISEKTAGKATYFVHDDQYGPYLALDSLIDASRTALGDQAYDGQLLPQILEVQAQDKTEPFKFPEDRTQLVISGSPLSGEDVERQAEAFIIPTPHRLILTPAEAEADAYAAFAEELVGRRSTPPLEPEPWRVRTSVLMGIDYKRVRIEALREQGDADGAKLFASVHLAEWVVVVEGLNSDGQSAQWEFVYDGTSGATSTIIQLARLGGSVIVDPPESGEICGVGSLGCDTFPLLLVPLRIGKSD